MSSIDARTTKASLRSVDSTTEYADIILESVKDFGSRLQTVGVLPTLLAVWTVALLVLADAPSNPLNADTLRAVGKQLGAGGAILLSGVAIAVAVSLQPLQFRLVQLLEGYWPTWLGAQLTRAGVCVQAWRRERLVSQLTVGAHEDATGRLRAHARGKLAGDRLRERFPTEERLLPTALGNALRAAEDRAGSRYGAEVVVLWPRLFQLLPADVRNGIEDEVTQLDVSARLCITWSAAAATGSVVLLTDPGQAVQNSTWIALVAGLWLLAVLSYFAAIESAVAHGVDVEVAMDLHRHLVIQAMRLTQPTLLSRERRLMRRMCTFFQTYDEDHTMEFRLKEPASP